MWKHLDFTADIPAQVCGERLRSNIDQLRFTILPDPYQKSVVGNVENGSFRIRKKRDSQNSLAPILVGRFHDEAELTRVVGRFRPSYVSLAIWAVFLAIAATGLLTITWRGFLLTASSIALYLAFIVIFALSWVAGAKEERYLEQFLRDILAGKTQP